MKWKIRMIDLFTGYDVNVASMDETNTLCLHTTGHIG